MKLTLEHVMDRFLRTEQRRSGYKALCEDYLRMYKLDAGFNRSLEQAIMQGQEQIVTPAPYNVVGLALRLLSTTPEIRVIPAAMGKQKSIETAKTKEKFLSAMWKQVNLDARRNVLADAEFNGVTMGRPVFDVRWVKQALPKMRRERQFPISVRALDPRNVGYFNNSVYTEFAYHTYRASLLEINRRWPELQKNTPYGSTLWNTWYGLSDNGADEDIDAEVIDFWYISEEDGSVWNTVLVEDAFAKEPARTDYPDLPIMVGRGDYALGMGDDYDGLSILHPMLGLWQYECRLISQMATGVMYEYWPGGTVQNEFNNPVPDIVVSPGQFTPVPWGTKVDYYRAEPNNRIAETVYQQVEAYLQQSTFPDVMYGKAPGELAAGYGVSILSDAAKGRLKMLTESLEMMVAHVNSFCLALIETMAGPQGLTLYSFDERDRQGLKLTITPEDIAGNYDNSVKLTPNTPDSETARTTLGLRLSEARKISDETLWNTFMGEQIPTDERKRIDLENALMSEELRPVVIQQTLVEQLGEKKALQWLFNTPLMPPPPQGMQWMQEKPFGPVTAIPAPPQMGMPMGGPPMGGPPQLPGPTGPAGLLPGPVGPPPPMAGPQGMPPPLPPELMMLIESGQIPPEIADGLLSGQIPPEMLMELMAQAGLLGGGGPPPPPSLQPPAMPTPQGGGIPPWAQGQLEPEMVGLPPVGAPLDFANLMGQPLPPQEELAAIAGMPGGF